MDFKRIMLLYVIILCFMAKAWGQHKFVERSTDILCLAPAATGLVKALVEKDRKGCLQLSLSAVTGIAFNYGLNACVKKKRPEMPARPDWGDRHAFPSTHSMAAFDGATFLMRRYGWKWGVPAYAVSCYVAWGRVHAGKHDWWDVLGGAVVGAGAALIYTRPFAKKTDVAISPAVFDNQGAGVHVAMRF